MISAIEKMGEMVANQTTKSIEEGIEKGLKESTKKIEKELENTKIKLDNVVATVNEFSTEIDEGKRKELTSEIEKVINSKPIKVNAKVQANVGIDKSHVKQQAEDAVDEIQQALQKAMIGHKREWRSFDLLEELKDVDLDTSKIEKKLSDLYKKTNNLTKVKPQDNKQFVALYSAHKMLGGKAIDDYESYFNNLVDYKNLVEGKVSKENFFQSVVGAVQQLIPLLQAANAETENLNRNASGRNMHGKAGKQSGNSTTPTVSLSPESVNTDVAQKEQKELRNEVKITTEAIKAQEEEIEKLDKSFTNASNNYFLSGRGKPSKKSIDAEKALLNDYDRNIESSVDNKLNELKLQYEEYNRIADDLQKFNQRANFGSTKQLITNKKGQKVQQYTVSLSGLLNAIKNNYDAGNKDIAAKQFQTYVNRGGKVSANKIAEEFAENLQTYLYQANQKIIDEYNQSIEHIKNNSHIVRAYNEVYYKKDSFNKARKYDDFRYENAKKYYEDSRPQKEVMKSENSGLNSVKLLEKSISLMDQYISKQKEYQRLTDEYFTLEDHEENAKSQQEADEIFQQMELLRVTLNSVENESEELKYKLLETYSSYRQSGGIDIITSDFKELDDLLNKINNNSNYLSSVDFVVDKQKHNVFHNKEDFRDSLIKVFKDEGLNPDGSIIKEENDKIIASNEEIIASEEKVRKVRIASRESIPKVSNVTKVNNAEIESNEEVIQSEEKKRKFRIANKDYLSQHSPTVEANKEEADSSSTTTAIVATNEEKKQKASEETARKVEEDTNRIVAANKKVSESSNKENIGNFRGVDFDLNSAKVLKQINTANGVITTYKTAEGQIASVLKDINGNESVLSVTTNFEDLKNKAEKSLETIVRFKNELRDLNDKYGDNFEPESYEKSIEKEQLKLESYVSQAQIYAEDSKYALKAEQMLKDYAEVRDNILDKQARKDSVYNAKIAEKNEKEMLELKQRKSEYSKKLSSINDSFSNMTEYKEVQNAISQLSGTDRESISEVETAFNNLNEAINTFKQNVKSSASLDPVFAATKKKNNIQTIVEGYEIEFEKLGRTSDEAKNKVEALQNIANRIEQIDTTQENGMATLGEELKLFNAEEESLKSILKLEKERKTLKNQKDREDAKNTKYSSDSVQTHKDLESALQAATIGGASFKGSSLNSDGSATIKFIEQVGDKAYTTTFLIKDMQLALQELQSGNFDPTGDNYIFKGQSTSTLKQKGVISLEQAYNKLGKTYEKYIALQEKEKAGTATKEQLVELKNLTAERNRYQEVLNRESQNRDLSSLTEKESLALEKYNAKLSQEVDLRKKYADSENEIKNALSNTSSIMYQIKDNKDLQGFDAVFDNAQKEVEEFNSSLKSGSIDVDAYSKKIQGIANKLNNTVAVLDDGIDVEDAMKKLARSLPNAELGDFNNTAKTLQVTFKKGKGIVGDVTLGFDEATHSIVKLKEVTRQADTSFGSFLSGLKKRAQSLAQYLLTFASFYEIAGWVREGVTVIRELDTALTEMRKVSDETVESLKNFQKVSFDIAESVGTTAAQIQNSTADWMRLGESLEQATESAKVANILFNVSEFESIDAATESLVAMSAAYKDLDKIDIVSKLNIVGNNYSIATDGLATALQDSASALLTAGNNIDEAIALVTSGNAVTQDPNSVGGAMRTISLRLTGTKEASDQLSELGESTEGVITTTSKLRDTIMSATKVAANNFKGFDILDENGNYKSTYEIKILSPYKETYMLC